MSDLHRKPATWIPLGIYGWARGGKNPGRYLRVEWSEETGGCLIFWGLLPFFGDVGAEAWDDWVLPEELQANIDWADPEWLDEESVRTILDKAYRPAVRKKVFVSFDTRHDVALRDRLVEESRREDSTFEVVGSSGGGTEKTSASIKAADLFCAICGEHTGESSVGAELQLAESEGKECFLLGGHPDRSVEAPTDPWRQIYWWGWSNLRALIAGAR